MEATEWLNDGVSRHLVTRRLCSRHIKHIFPIRNDRDTGRVALNLIVGLGDISVLSFLPLLDDYQQRDFFFLEANIKELFFFSLSITIIIFYKIILNNSFSFCYQQQKVFS